MTGTSRRRFLAGAGLVGLAGLTAACADTAPEAPPPPGGLPPSSTVPTTTSSAPPAYEGSAASVAVCAALSALEADLLGDAVAGAGQGRYGAVPGVVTALLAGAVAQSTEHARAFNGVLTAAGLPAVDGFPLTVEPVLRARLAAAVAPVDLIGLALDVATLGTATVTAAVGRIVDPAATTVAVGVAPVVAMQAATASFLLGRLPPAPVDPTVGALGPDALTA